MAVKEEVVSSNRVSWDVMFFDDLINHDGFLITDPDTVSLDGRKEKTMYGPRSPLYGTTYGDEQAFLERHSCKCGAFKGYQFKGELCPLCNTRIEAKDPDIKKTGWISLGDNLIIAPYWYKLFIKLIGKKPFLDMIDTTERVDSNGNRSHLEAGKDYTPVTPYSMYGIDGFYENFDEIMDYFASKKKNKASDFEKCKKEKRKVFTHHIPVYSTFLRPQSSTSDTFYYNGVDKHINPLFNLSESIKDCEPIEHVYYQNKIQERANLIWDYNFDIINHKEGFIRNKLIAGSLNWTSRCVIVPDPTLRVDEVDISYQAFRILFKYRIIYYLMKLGNIPLSSAYYRWKAAYKFDSYVHKVMNYIVSAEKPRIFLNRNPTLNLYSMLLLKIRKVKDDPHRTTLSVPLTILPGLNADFDGDILNLIAIFDEAMIDMYKKFDPIQSYMFNRHTGGLNKNFGLTKGQITNLYQFATYKEEEGIVQPDTEKLMVYINNLKEEYENRPPRIIYPH